MKQLLMALAASAALTASAQVGQGSQKAEANSNQTVLIEGQDGRTREFHSGALGSVDLEKMANVVDLENLTSSQAGCPVQILSASFEHPGQVMLTSHATSVIGPSLHLSYRNFSGKDIESVVMTGWIKVKDSPYQLDSVSHPFTLELSRKSLLSKDVESSQILKLVSNAIGYDRIELSQVNYADGSSWKPQRKCVYANAGSTERASAW
jgi:hypothetical protein